MSHRTLVAYDRDGYDLHEAHSGVDPESITSDTPFGETPHDSWHSDPKNGTPSGEPRQADTQNTAIETDPIATDLSFVEIGSHVDPIDHESLYVVDASFSVQTYVVFGLGGRAFGPGNGPAIALIGYTDEADAAYLRGWLAGGRAVRSVCGPEEGAIVRALRWLDPERGAVVWLAGGEQLGSGDVPDAQVSS